MEISSSSIIKYLFSKWWTNDIVGHLRRLDRFVVLTENAVAEWPELNNITMIPDPLVIVVKEKKDFQLLIYEE